MMNVYNIKEYTQNYHGTKQILFGELGMEYKWGRIKMKAIGWSIGMSNIAKFLETNTGQKIDTLLLTQYNEEGCFQPYHQDKTNRGVPTQVLDISVGPERILEIRHKHIRSWKYEMKLQEGRIYIFTHLFNYLFEHRYIHRSDILNFSLTGRNDE